ncbi:MAG: nickel-dependent lactate racemase [Chloroflexota bacterium]|nr:nickel-dependent lactate racemase [Chloroflexota bacterium]
MRLTMPFGRGSLSADLPAGCTAEVIRPRTQPPAADPAALVRDAVYTPLGAVEPPRAGQTVAIAINDKTRPVPHEHLLPPVLQGMRHAGVRDEDVTFIIATGTHPGMTPDEYDAIFPREIIATYRVLCHDGGDETNLTRLGETARGTPVWINSVYLAADYRIVIGNIEPHQFQGFSGGVKSAAIGLAGASTINHNHAMMRHEGARLGEYDANPARLDVEEIGRMIGIDFAVNAILNSDKQIVKAFAGDPAAVMRAGIPAARALCQIPVAEPFDLMIASPGGHPKDINIYQSQKGMAHAALITRSGGRLILCAACPEGSGNADYERWMADARLRSHADVFERFERDGFRVGRHKAWQVSRDAARIHTALVSELDADFARGLLFEPQPDLQSAIDAALAALPAGALIGVMPAANATIPVLQFV